MSLDGSLIESPIPPTTRHVIVNHFWGTRNSDTLESFFQYYTEQCRIAWSVNGSQMAIKRHQDVLDIVTDIKNGTSREGIKQNLVAKSHATNTINGDIYLESAIDLAVRLLLMIDVGALRNAFSGRRRLLWKEGDGSLKDFTQEIFSDKPQSGHNGVKLGQSFTARTLDYVAGFRVELTANLADHLRLRDGKTVAIFHYVSFLKSQQESTSLLPEGLAQETLLTLALLFPRGDKDVVKWYNKQGDPEDLDQEVLNCGQLGKESRQITEYRFWYDRLVHLKDAFDEAQPNTVAQLWNDRRDQKQWLTLWVAIGLTLFFGLVQSIEGAMQVYKSYHPTAS